MKKATLLLAALMAAAPLAGCAGGPGSSAVSFVKPESVIGAGVNGDEEMRLPAYELTEKKVSLLFPYDPGELTVFKEIYGGETDLTIVPNNQMSARFQQLVNADTPPDVFNYAFMPTFITKGYVQAVEDYIDFDTPLWEEIREVHELSTVDGKLYMVDPMCGRYSGLWYNKTIFANAGMKNPGELLAENNWNWDTYRDAAIKLTVKGAGNNITQWGTAIDTPESYIYSTGTDFVSFNQGEPVNNIKSNEISRAMNFLIGLYTKDNCTYQGGDTRDQFAQGKIAMIESHLWYRDPLQEMVRNNEIGFVPTPKDPQADKYYILDQFGSAGMWIPRGAKNPTGAAAYICAFRYSHLDADKKKEVFDRLVETIGWTQELEDMVNEMQSSKYTSVSFTVPTFNITEFYGDMFARPKDGEPWATIAEELAPKIDANISKAMSS